jgi:hypothetical protein
VGLEPVLQFGDVFVDTKLAETEIGSNLLSGPAAG